MKRKHNIKRILVGMLAVVFGGSSMIISGLLGVKDASAFGLSPMNQVIVLNPGDTYRNTLTISNNSVEEKSDFHYKVTVTPYYVDENDTSVYDEYSDRTLITDWITLIGDESGVIPEGESKDIEYVINVPENAPSGGQYASITVTSDKDPSAEENSFGINESLAIAHLIYAEIAGNTVRQGEITSASVPGFIFSGGVKGISVVKNTGNVHGTAEYVLKVFPLFSDEEVYTNEEKPLKKTVLPDRELYDELVWEETPMVGIFNVVYSVDFEGVTTEVSKMVIKCPIWLLFIILAVIAGIIIWIVLRIRMRSKKKE